MISGQTIRETSGSLSEWKYFRQFWHTRGDPVIPVIMWAGSGSGNQLVNNLFWTLKLVRQQGENWLKCDDDDVRIFCILFMRFTFSCQVSPIHEEDVLKLSGGGDWHTAYLLIYGPRFAKNAWKMLICYFSNQMMFSSQKTSQAARPENRSRHNSSGSWRGKDGELENCERFCARKVKRENPKASTCLAEENIDNWHAFTKLTSWEKPIVIALKSWSFGWYMKYVIRSP